MKHIIKKAREEFFGKEGVRDTFNKQLVSDLTLEEGKKMREFWHYCNSTIKCPNCSSQKFETCKSEDDYSLKFTCTVCLSVTVLYDSETQKLVRWFDDLLIEKSGISFADGWPGLVEFSDSMKLRLGKKPKINGTFNE